MSPHTRRRWSSLALTTLLAATTALAPTSQSAPASPTTVTLAAATGQPETSRWETGRWEEDSLPRDLDQWAVERDADLWGPARADTLAPGHRGCWAAVTRHATLLRCPDGHHTLRLRRTAL